MTPHGSRIRLAAPITLIAVGIAWLSGCIPIPGNYQRRDGQPRTEKLIGNATSDRPVRMHVSSRPDVEQALGAPTRRSPDDSLWRYTYNIDSEGGLLFPLCFMYIPNDMHGYGGRRHVDLEFDPSGRLRSFALRSDPESYEQGMDQRLAPDAADAPHRPQTPPPPARPPTPPQHLSDHVLPPDGRRYPTNPR